MAGFAAENFYTTTQIAVGVLQNNKLNNLSIKKKRMKAGGNADSIEQLIFKKI